MLDTPFTVIPAQAEIQGLSVPAAALDPRLCEGDE
jgi:hypothetical protein